MENNWFKQSNIFTPHDVSEQMDKLPKGIYVLGFSQMKGFYLTRISEKFPLPAKTYGVQDVFINRVLRTWEATNTNLGVLLNGIRGTGKTVTCEMIANRMDAPTIIISEAFDGVDTFLVKIQQDAVILFDEFEKTYPREYGKPSGLLSLMDGVSKGEYRKMFMLTTNELSVEPNMIQRPGRIRYLKTFGNLHPDIIQEILEDKLNNKAQIKPVLSFISELELITIDIVCATADEVNIHGDLPEDFKDIFNIKKISTMRSIYEVITDPPNCATGIPVKEVMVYNNSRISPDNLETAAEGDGVYVNGDYVAAIQQVLTPDMAMVYVDYTDDEELAAESAGITLPKAPVRMWRFEDKISINRVFSGSRLLSAYD